MRRCVKIALLTAAVMCLLGLAVSSAYASQQEYSFVAEEYPVELEAVTHNDGFEVTGGVGICENATYVTGPIAAPTTSVSVTATYSGCKGEIGGKVYKASVSMNGCTYNFHHFVSESQTVAGKVSVECQSGHEIEVKIPELNANCVGRILAQTELPGTTYTLATSATGWPTIRAAAVLADVEYSSEDCPGLAKSSKEEGAKPGRLEEGELSGAGASEEIKLTGAPLDAEIKGYKAGAAHEEANEIGVEGQEDHAIASGGGQITGTVTSVLAAPIEGIRVTVSGTTERNSGFYGSATTNAGGEYTVSGLPSGAYEVEFSTVHGSSPDYLTQYYNGAELSSQAEAVTVTAPATTGEVNAELQATQALQPPGRITGTITSAVTKAPLEEAEVEVDEAATERFVARTSTNAQGQYTVSGLAPGEYKVKFSDGSSWVTEFYSGKTSFAAAEAVEVSAGATTPGIDGELQRAGAITGEVTSEATGQGIDVINVVVYEAGVGGGKVAEAQTGGSGDYTVLGLRPGEYVLEFYSGVPGSNGKNYATQYYPGQTSRSAAQPVKVTEGETRSGIDAKLQSGGQISGTVTNASKEPIEGAAVIAYDSEGNEAQSSFTDSNGEYTVAGLASGTYEVQFIAAPRYVTQYYDNASSFSGASAVAVKAGNEETTPGINAELMAATPPEKVKPPAVTGTAAVGQTLTCSAGEWKGAPTPEEFTYRWLIDGATAIAGATNATYKVPSADESHALVCEVIAESSAGEATAKSAATAPVPVIKPANTGRPFVSGTAAVGQTLACSHGTWESSPTGYTYQWSEGTTPIASATAKTYEITGADEGQTLACEVTAANSAGPSAPEPSANGASVPSLPVNTVAPEVTVQGGGAAFVGEALSCSNGAWAGTPTPAFTYKWLREGTAISGAEASTYVVQAADEGRSVSCEVTATNAAGPAAPEPSSNSKSVPSLPPGLENIGSGQGSAKTTDGALSATGAGAGAGAVTVGEYASQPAGTPALGDSTGKWFDVFLEPGSSYKSLTITDCGLGTVATSIDWYNPQGGSGSGEWEAVANANETPSVGCITITISGSSTPTLAQLTGTVFGVIATPPQSTPGPGSSNSTTTSGGAATAAATGRVSLAGSAISIKGGGKASVKLVCAGTAACTGRLTLTAKGATGKGTKGKQAKVEAIGTAAFSIPAGKTATVTIALTAAGRALLKAHHGRVGATLTIREFSGGSTSTQHERVQLVQKAAAKARRGK